MLESPLRRLFVCSLKAFTLVEILVVIAIMAILAALLIPTAQSMISNGQTSKCASNQRQIVQGMLRWIDENNGFMPVYTTSSQGSGGWLWYARLSRDTDGTPPANLPYAGHNPLLAGESEKTIWICPANNPFKVKESTKDCSYGIPNAIFANQPTSPSQATNKLINFAKPSRTVAIGDCSLNASTAYKISSDSDIATPHKGGCNMTFLDGHGEFFKSPPAYTNGIFKKTGGE
jgi:prepilin-type N-terminal cleavage/methylation domain-containing protein/prepilin-type processing-associated H-X9-DG protein